MKVGYLWITDSRRRPLWFRLRDLDATEGHIVMETGQKQFDGQAAVGISGVLDRDSLLGSSSLTAPSFGLMTPRF
jgi:hypothetical protein